MKIFGKIAGLIILLAALFILSATGSIVLSAMIIASIGLPCLGVFFVIYAFFNSKKLEKRAKQKEEEAKRYEEAHMFD